MASCTFTQHRFMVMTCCLTTPSHYLNQCWLIISEVFWHSYEGGFTGNAQDIYHWCELKITNLSSRPHLPGAIELNMLFVMITNNKPFDRKTYFQPIGLYNIVLLHLETYNAKRSISIELFHVILLNKHYQVYVFISVRASKIGTNRSHESG